MDGSQEILSNLILELRRGTIIISVLSQLESDKYGYSLVQSLEEKGVPVDASTLYPLLRRLEKQGLLKSEWETSGTKPRKYYVMTADGAEIYAALCREWREMSKSVELLITEGDNSNGVKCNN